MHIFWQDVRYALRTMARDPGFTVILVSTIALGIGATTAVYSVANALPRAVLIWMSAAVAIALLIACVNCANLLIARGMMRRNEVALRAAMGADWGRVFRLMLTESVVLAMAGGAVGVLLAWWSTDFVMGLKAGIGVRTLGFTAAVSVVSGLLFGLAPALDSMRSDGHELIKRSEEGSAPRLQLLRGANLVVIAEVALALSLMIGAGMMMEQIGLRFEATLLGAFAVVTLALAMAGVYAVTWQMVGRRSREISIRIALGARRGEVMRMVAGQSMLLVAIGSGVGLVTGVFASRALETGSDTVTILAVSAILAVAAAPASYFPARAAAQIEPRMALKSD